MRWKKHSERWLNELVSISSNTGWNRKRVGLQMSTTEPSVGKLWEKELSAATKVISAKSGTLAERFIGLALAEVASAAERVIISENFILED